MTKKDAAILARLFVRDWKRTYARQPEVIITDSNGKKTSTKRISDIEIVRFQLEFYGRNADLFRNFVNRVSRFTPETGPDRDFVSRCWEWCEAQIETA